MVKVRAVTLVLFYISSCSPVYVLKVAAIEATWEVYFGFKMISLFFLSHSSYFKIIMSSFSMDNIRNVCRCSHSNRVVWVNLKKWEERHFEYNCHGQGLRKFFSLQSSWLSHKGPYQLVQREGQTVLSVSAKHKCLVSLRCPWVPGYPSLAQRLRQEALRGSVLGSQWQGTGCCWAGGWTDLLLQSFTSWKHDDVGFLAFCFSVFLVSR